MQGPKSATSQCVRRPPSRDEVSRVFKRPRVRFVFPARPVARGVEPFAIEKNCSLDCARTNREHAAHSSIRNIAMLNRLASGPQPESDRLDIAADQAIAACGGDMRSAVRALILANEFLEYELCEMFKAVTNAPRRGRIPENRADWFD
jgi:hypothetical protein